MTVKELITLLHTFDPELPVLTAVPDDNLDEINNAAVCQVRDSGRRLHMCGKYEEMNKFMSNNTKAGEPFAALILEAL